MDASAKHQIKLAPQAVVFAEALLGIVQAAFHIVYIIVNVFCHRQNSFLHRLIEYIIRFFRIFYHGKIYYIFPYFNNKCNNPAKKVQQHCFSCISFFLNPQ